MLSKSGGVDEDEALIMASEKNNVLQNQIDQQNLKIEKLEGLNEQTLY